MDKESFKDVLPGLFTIIFKQTVNKDFDLPAPIIKQATDPFIDKFNKDNVINVGNYVDYIIHQCHIWREWDKWKKNFNLSWVFGSKAIERFTTSKPGVKYYQDLWLKEIGCTRESIKDRAFNPNREHPMQKFVHYPSDDIGKARFINTDMGYRFCVTETLMWSPSSDICVQCNYVEKCKSELNKQYPELLRLRENQKQQR
ncbi:MAG: hypothetical protein ACRC6V_17770 [Bacteroidales bacterium]